nr:MAG TPA: hypothetical protein [Caudoviricetes sp.]
MVRHCQQGRKGYNRPLHHGFTSLSRDTPYLTIVKGARIVKNVNNEERKLKTRS